MSSTEPLAPHAKQLLRRIKEGGGVLSPEVVAELCEALDTDRTGLALRLLPIAQGFAHVPVSGFSVGAVAFSEAPGATGGLYFGANLEVAGQALGFSVHAEQSAAVNAWHHGEPEITHLAVSAAPCGHCRQYLLEFPLEGELEIILPQDSGGPRVERLRSLLPQSFGPSSLSVERSPPGVTRRPEPQWTPPAPLMDSLPGLAYEAAVQSYAPYTKGRAGVSIEAAGGERFFGSYSESVAYNPSLTPLLAALSVMNVTLPVSKSRTVVRAVLVESPGTISQLEVTRVVLSAVAPEVELEYHALGSR